MFLFCVFTTLHQLYQVIEFLFFLMLIFCVCKILLQFIGSLPPSSSCPSADSCADRI